MKKPVCIIQGCQERIKKGLLMCADHWRIVPKPIRDSIKKHYKPGQNIHSASPAYMGALRDAIKYVKQNTEMLREPQHDNKENS